MSNKNIVLAGSIIRILLIIFFISATFFGLLMSVPFASSVNEHGGFSSMSLDKWFWILSPIIFASILYFIIKISTGKIKKLEE